MAVEDRSNEYGVQRGIGSLRMQWHQGVEGQDPTAYIITPGTEEEAGPEGTSKPFVSRPGMKVSGNEAGWSVSLQGLASREKEDASLFSHSLP